MDKPQHIFILSVDLVISSVLVLFPQCFILKQANDWSTTDSDATVVKHYIDTGTLP